MLIICHLCFVYISIISSLIVSSSFIFSFFFFFVFFVLFFFFFFFFFFQAEDGIRDGTVTGVQTCALPISGRWAVRTSSSRSSWTTGWSCTATLRRRRSSSRPTAPATTARSGAWSRSEERRVGKECRSRWSRYH